VVLSLKIRQGIVLVATGVFFSIAIAAQLQGAPGLDVYMKAGAACLILVASGLVLVRIIDDASAKSQGRPGATHEAVPASGIGREPAKSGQV